WTPIGHSQRKQGSFPVYLDRESAAHPYGEGSVQFWIKIDLGSGAYELAQIAIYRDERTAELLRKRTYSASGKVKSRDYWPWSVREAIGPGSVMETVYRIYFQSGR